MAKTKKLKVAPKVRPSPLQARKVFNVQQAIRQGKEGVEKFVTQGQQWTKKLAPGFEMRAKQVIAAIKNAAGYGGVATAGAAMVPKGTAILAAPGAVGIEAGTALAGAGIAPAGIKTAPKALSFWKDKAMWKQWGTMIAFTVGLYALSKISRSKTESEMMELQIQLMQSQVPTKEELVTQQMLQVLSADMMGGQGGVATPVNQPRGQGGIGLAPSERAVGGPPADQAELMRVLQSM